jgi:hypothetical protein
MSRASADRYFTARGRAKSTDPWLNEDRAIGLDNPEVKPMSLEAFEASGILRILTPDLAIDRFKRMQARMPVEHLIKMLAPLPPVEVCRLCGGLGDGGDAGVRLNAPQP